jgi:hypothetical protein
VIDVPLTTTALVAATPPRLTVAFDMKPVPLMLSAVPPAVVPEVGEIPETVGAGFVLSEAVLKATACITHRPLGLSVAEAVYVPLEVVGASSAISPSGTVIIRLVNPLPGPVVPG